MCLGHTKGPSCTLSDGGNTRSPAPRIFVLLFCTLVRPHLEYAIQTTCPYLKKDMDFVGRVQRLATSKVKDMKDISYAEWLSELGLQTLEHPRFRGDLFVAFSM